MNQRFIESRKLITDAREALKKGNMTQARQLAERAAELAPQSEDPWLILAAVVSPRESASYIRKALEVNPNSPRAQKGMERAMQQLGEKPKAHTSPEVTQPTPSVSKNGTPGRKPSKNPGKRRRVLPILFVLVGLGVFAFAAWSAVNSPVMASILNFSATPQADQSKPFAQVNIPKPAAQPLVEVSAPTATPSDAPTEVATQAAEVAAAQPTTEPTLEAVIQPTDTAAAPTATSQPAETAQPGAVYAEIVADTPTAEFTAPTAEAPSALPEFASSGERWIDVDLSQQRLYAYEGNTLVNSFIVSTGTWQTPTVTGTFNIWVKLRSTSMSGPGYYLPNVPYVMYFYKDYGLHGTYWHNNFGTPMSHGCVNLATPDAEWLYNFASVGTVVNVHD
jgi:lipoprotein-anchoring transpeptidase ErfK/SrfK